MRTKEEIFFITYREQLNRGKGSSQESQEYIHAPTKESAKKYLQSVVPVSRIISIIKSS